MTGPGLPVRLPITTDRLVLRPHTMEDLDDLVVFHSDPEVALPSMTTAVIRWKPRSSKARPRTRSFVAGLTGPPQTSGT